jgi:hypothetical protein
MVIIGAVEIQVIKTIWQPVGQDVMYSLDMERLLDFGVRSDKEMDDDQGWKEKSENPKCYKKQLVYAA